MFRHFHNRAGHYLLLTGVWAILALPNLGTPSLWDIDEGHNAECAREMLDSGNWLVPTFNFQLRDHKPPFLYWLQIAAYERFGVNEFSARLPSALAALAAILLAYELGRLMFGRASGLLAGLILDSAAMFCAAGHFANPDSLLNVLTLAAFYTFCRSLPRSAGASSLGGMLSRQRLESMAHSKPSTDASGPRLNGWWTTVAGVCMGLAVLTKGPVGLLLPLAVIGMYMLLSRQPRLLFDLRLSWGVAAFILLAVPWYAWISAETKGEFSRGFFLTHNFGRFMSPMENHHGPIYYYLIVLLLGFAPWSPFFVPAIVYGFSRRAKNETGRQEDTEIRRHVLFLACWIVGYMVFFSISGTKLPNYILPIYPAVAIVTAMFLDQWRRGLILVPRWVIGVSLGGVAIVGLGFAVAVLSAGGVINVSALRGRVVNGLETWAGIGLIPMAGALLAAWLFRLEKRAEMVISLVTALILFVSTIAAWGSLPIDAGKAPRPLVGEAGTCQTERDIRIGCYQFYQPSLVFYCRREVRVLNNQDEALEFLRYPLPVYLFVSAQAWESLRDKVSGPHHRLAHHHDVYKGIVVVVITNQ